MCLVRKEGWFGYGQPDHRLRIVLLDMVKEVVMVELSLQFQQHQQVTQLSRVTHLVKVAVSARTDCMLFRLARIGKVLLMSSLVRYVSYLDVNALLYPGDTLYFVTS